LLTSLQRYEKAINARAFDIARGFIPAGATTFVSWHTNLRQASDHLKRLRHHPLEEVRSIASEVMSSLQSKYTSSFLHKTYRTEEEYLERNVPCSYHFEMLSSEFDYVSHLRLRNNTGASFLTEESFTQELLRTRPEKAELHPRFREFGDMVFKFPLDYGSYRDLQRHRSAINPMPMLTHRLGFEPWYVFNYKQLRCLQR
jgi:hypothetical protein